MAPIAFIRAVAPPHTSHILALCAPHAAGQHLGGHGHGTASAPARTAPAGRPVSLSSLSVVRAGGRDGGLPTMAVHIRIPREKTDRDSQIRRSYTNLFLVGLALEYVCEQLQEEDRTTAATTAFTYETMSACRLTMFTLVKPL